MNRAYLNISELTAAAKANDCTVHLHQEADGRNVFSVGNGNIRAREFASYDSAMKFTKRKESRESNSFKPEPGMDESEFGACPICATKPTFLNVGREHYAVCHEHKVYWHVGSNLFSAWRDESPESWESNKKLLASYRSASDVREAAMCNGPSNIEYLRRPLGTLGDCLAETASRQPYGYARFTGCTESFWRDIPADNPDKPWFVLEGVTACLDPAPVTIFISNGTTAAPAREILEQVAKWLKEHGDELHELTPRTTDDSDSMWDDDNESIPF